MDSSGALFEATVAIRLGIGRIYEEKGDFKINMNMRRDTVTALAVMTVCLAQVIVFMVLGETVPAVFFTIAMAVWAVVAVMIDKTE